MRFLNRFVMKLLWRFARRFLRNRILILSAVAIAGLGIGSLITFFLQERAMDLAQQELNRAAQQVSTPGEEGTKGTAKPAASIGTQVAKGTDSSKAAAVTTAPSSTGIEASPARPSQTPPFPEITMPVEGRVVSEPGWKKHQKFGDWRYDPGIGIQASPGAPVKAALSGVVASVEEVPDEGITVRITHQDGRESSYAGLSRSTVSPGAKVKGGDVIGNIGSDPPGNVLHFELYKGETPEDPRGFFR